MATKKTTKKRSGLVDMRIAPPEPVFEERVEVPVFETPAPQMQASSVAQPRRRRGGKSIFVLLLLTIILLGAAGYLYHEWTVLRQNPRAATEEKTKEMVERVERLIDLPKGETPTLVHITDTESLQGQPFFEKAEKGHIVLYYTVARKVYLYDPSADILVEVTTLGEGSKI